MSFSPFHQEVLHALRVVIDPDLHTDIVSLGFVQQLVVDRAQGLVSFTLQLTTPACPVKEQFKQWCREALLPLTWVVKVDVTISAKAGGKGASKGGGKGLAGVRHIIAVSSCKGGVGKSTVAVNLAYSIQRLGAKVGLLDADVHGPSLPIMVQPKETRLMKNKAGDMVAPLQHEGVLLMSYGWVQKKSEQGSAVMRGPRSSAVASQMLTLTDWGELDYLVIDMPPGTGDIALSLVQDCSISAAVVVTTPQLLSFVDVVKGIEMFDGVRVPCVAVVENMAFYTCGSCSQPTFPFGPGHRQRLMNEFGIAQSYTLPIDAQLSAAGDTGIPLALSRSAPAIAQTFDELAAGVVRQVAVLSLGAAPLPPLVEFDDRNRRVTVTPHEGQQVLWTFAQLRAACLGAGNKQPPRDVRPTAMRARGNYAIGISWSDGHESIYPHAALLKGPRDAAEGV